MSVKALSAAFDSDYGRETAARRLVMLALADAAGDDGITWISQAAIAVKARVTEPTVRAAIHDLEECGMLQTVKAVKGRTRRNVYRFLFPGAKEPEYDRLPFELEQPFATTETLLRSSDGDDDRNSGALTTVTGLRSRARVCSSDLEPSVEPLDAREALDRQGVPERPGTVDRKRVTDAEYEFAASALLFFNATAGTVYKSKEWIAKIVARIREFPDLTLEAHEVVIARAFAAPWWNGTSSPSVVYGNRGVFERAVHAVRDDPTATRGMTPEEMESWAGDA